MGRKVTFPVMNQIFVQIRVKGLFVWRASRKEIAFKESRRQKSPLPPEEGEIRESLNAVGVR